MRYLLYILPLLLAVPAIAQITTSQDIHSASYTLNSIARSDARLGTCRQCIKIHIPKATTAIVYTITSKEQPQLSKEIKTILATQTAGTSTAIMQLNNYITGGRTKAIFNAYWVQPEHCRIAFLNGYGNYCNTPDFIERSTGGTFYKDLGGAVQAFDVYLCVENLEQIKALNYYVNVIATIQQH